MKVLFLDIDGVINKRENFNPAHNPGPYPVDAYCAFLVGRIQLSTGCRVVLSSTWRLHKEGRENVSKRVIELYDVTPEIYNKPPGLDKRCYEISSWLSYHPEVEKFAILDDESDAGDLASLRKHFFKTTFEDGLTDEIAEAVIEHLGRV